MGKGVTDLTLFGSPSPYTERERIMVITLSYLKKVFARISVAMVESGQWPGWTMVSGTKAIGKCHYLTSQI
jgi:hypothetical protein